MVTFQTLIPVSRDHSIQDFIDLCLEWLRGSPHYKITTILREEIPDFNSTIRLADEVLELANWAEGDTEIAGLRFSNTHDGITWHTFIVGHRNPKRFLVSILVDNESDKPELSVTYAKKPHIVKLLVERFKLETDDFKTIDASPLIIDESNIDLAGQIFDGERANMLPVVYISAIKKELYAVNIKDLAYWLQGVAHVLVEKDIQTSLKMKFRVGGRNPYLGALGIIWPNTATVYKYMMDYYSTAEKFGHFMSHEVRKLWSLVRPIDKCKWSHLVDLRNRQAIKTKSLEADQNIEEVVANYTAEISLRDDEISRLDRQLTDLRNEFALQKTKYQNANVPLLFNGTEVDLYPSEIRETVLLVIQEKLKTLPPEYKRQRDILFSVLARNPILGEKERVIEDLRGILEGYVRLDPKRKNDLEALGFDVSQEGKHYKLVLSGDDRYIFSLPTTPSDHRTGMNSLRDIKKTLF